MKVLFSIVTVIAAMSLTGALSACQTGGQFDPVKTQVGAHEAHAASAVLLQGSADAGAIKGAAAVKAKTAMNTAELAIDTTDAVLRVAGDPDVQDANAADDAATALANDALDKASKVQ